MYRVWLRWVARPECLSCQSQPSLFRAKESPLKHDITLLKSKTLSVGACLPPTKCKTVRMNHFQIFNLLDQQIENLVSLDAKLFAFGAKQPVQIILFWWLSAVKKTYRWLGRVCLSHHRSATGGVNRAPTRLSHSVGGGGMGFVLLPLAISFLSKPKPHFRRCYIYGSPCGLHVLKCQQIL